MLNVNLILDRIKDLIQLKTDADLAKHLNVNRSVIGNWRSRGGMNYEKVLYLCEKNALDLNEVFFGKDNKLNRNVFVAFNDMLTILKKDIKGEVMLEIDELKNISLTLLELYEGKRARLRIDEVRESLVKHKRKEG